MEKFSELRMTLIILVIGTFFISGCFFNNKHTVTFKTNGGSEVANVSVKSGTTLEDVKEPTKEGYVFDGWYLEGEEFNFDTKVNEDITLVAKWIKVEEVKEEPMVPTTESTTTSSIKTTKKKIYKAKATKKKESKSATKKVNTVIQTPTPEKQETPVPLVPDEKTDDKNPNEKVEGIKHDDQVEDIKPDDTVGEKEDENVNSGTTTGETVNPSTPIIPEDSNSSSSSTSSESTTEKDKTELSSTPAEEESTSEVTSEKTSEKTTEKTTEKPDDNNPTPDEPKEDDEPVYEERDDKLVNLRIEATSVTPIENNGNIQTITINKNIDEITKANVYTMLSDEDINVLLDSDMNKWNIKVNNDYTYSINQKENISKLELKGYNSKINSLAIEVSPIEVCILEYVEKTDSDNNKVIEWNLVRPVAETSTNSLDKKYHSDLQSAVESAPKDEVVTVKLLTDVEVKDEIKIYTPVIIDGDGYKITKEKGYLFNIDKLEYKKGDELNINNVDLKINSMIKTGKSSFNNININNSTGIITGKTIENDEDERINLNYSKFYKVL